VEQEESEQRVTQVVNQVFKELEAISFQQFSRYFFTEGNSAYDSQLEGCPADLREPLTSYYCLSSHNTYLTGNQLTSDSRTERYLEDLEAGYRCL
jgi:phosphatidylinositol phospholipase C, gamma-2